MCFVFHCVRVRESSAQELFIFLISGDRRRRSGDYNWYQRARFRRWTRDRAIAAAFMDRRRNRSSSPRRGSHGTGSGGDGDRGLVIHRVVREETGKHKYPLLTKTNFYSWAALMRLKLQARSLWEAVNVGTADFVDDRNALEAITLELPEELHGSMANKATAKAAWDEIKKMHLGVDRVRQAKANTLRRQFQDLRFKDGDHSPSDEAT